MLLQRSLHRLSCNDMWNVHVNQIIIMSTSTIDIWLTTKEVVALLGINKSTIKRRIDSGLYQASKNESDGRGSYFILFSSLSQAAQNAYYLKLAREETARIIEPREQVEARNAQALEMARKAATNGKSFKPHIQPIPVNQEEYKALWAAWERSPQKAKQKAKLVMDALILYSNMQLDGVPKFEISRAIQKNFGISPATLWRKLKAVEGQSKDVWVPLLIPRWKGKVGEAEFTPEAWEYIKQEWGSQSKPSISRVLRDALKLVSERNWIIPSQDTVERRIRDLPPWWAVLRREGEKELKRLYPSQQRDYLCLGTMMFGDQTDATEAARIVASAREMGVNFIDTADVYSTGASEVITGELIKAERHHWVLASKLGNAMSKAPNEVGYSRSWMLRALEASLKRLQTEHVDILYLHRDFNGVDLEEPLRALEQMLRDGKIRYWGLSNFRGWRIAEAVHLARQLGMPGPSVCQPYYNLLNRLPEVEVLPACHHHHIGVVPYSPIARGVLTAKYTPGAAPPEGTRAARNDARIMQTEFREESLLIAQKLKAHTAAKGIALAHFATAWVLAHRAVT